MQANKPSKIQLALHILSYSFTTVRFFSIALLFSILLGYVFPRLFRDPYIFSLIFYPLAGYKANQYNSGLFISKLEEYFTIKQIRQGFMMMFAILALVILSFYIIIGDSYSLNSLIAFYFLPPIITCALTIIIALASKKGTMLGVREIVDDQLRFDRLKREFVIGVFVFFLSAYLSTKIFNLNSKIISILIAIIITCVFEILRISYLKQARKKPPLRAKTVNESHVPYQNMRHEYNNESVMATNDQPSAITETMHGNAAWITDVEKNVLTAKDNNGRPNYHGLWLGGGFFHHQEGNLVSVAPPGTGKGAALIIPNLLWERKYKQSFVVFDPKGTNACITARFRKEQGDKVIIIDPIGLQQMNNAKHRIASSCFNPLDHIKDDLYNGTSQIANLLMPDDPKSSDKYWSQEGRNLIQMILLHIMTSDEYIERRDLITLHKIIVSGDFTSLFKEMIVNRSMDGLIADTAMGFADMMITTEKMFTSVRSTASSSIKWLSNPALQKVMRKSDFNPTDLEKGNMTVYICQPISNKEGFATFSRLIIGFCLRANSMPSPTQKAWVYYLLDEFPTMGIFPEVIEALAFSREYRMRLWIFAQSLSQLDHIYKTEIRNEIIGNATVFQAFGVTDHVTQEYVSKRVGNQTVKFTTSSRSTNQSFGSSTSYGVSPGSGSKNEGTGTSYSDAFQGKPLISPAELELDPNIITLTKWGPMRLVRWQYWQDVYSQLASYYRNIFKLRADPNPNMAENNGQEQKVNNTESKMGYGPNGSFTFTKDNIR